MPKALPNQLEVQDRIRRALLDKNPDELVVAMLYVMHTERATRIATQLLRKMPQDVQDWWTHDCDFPHGKAAREQEASRIAAKFIAENDDR